MNTENKEIWNENIRDKDMVELLLENWSIMLGFEVGMN